MNDTRWDELRTAMYALDRLSPQWRTKDIDSGHVCPWDGDWFYHLKKGGYQSIEWIEIKITSLEQDLAVLDALKKIHVPGQQFPQAQ